MSFLNRNNVGISVGPSHVSIASAVRRGESVEIGRFAVELIQEKICRPSPVEKNITDLPRWQSHVRSVLGKFPRPSKVRLTLPDSAARTLLLDLEALPGERHEFEKLIQWHMEKAFLSSLGDSRFSYQVLERRAHWKVLATAVKKEVVEQYEGLDGSRSIEVSGIGLSSLMAFNLLQPEIGRTAGEAGHFIFVHLLDQTLTVLIFEAGLLSFIRVKELTEQGEGLDAEGGTSRSWTEILFEEIGMALSFYDVGERSVAAMTHLFFSIDTPIPDLEGRVKETFHLTPVVLDPYRLIRFPSDAEGELLDPARRTVVSAAAAAIGA